MPASTLTYSSELMQNFQQSEIMSPEGQFQALQSATGQGLLFAQSTAGVLNLAQEQPGTASGWILNDMSSAQIAKDFPGQSVVVVKTFVTTQNAADATIRLAMVVNDTEQDHLYLSLGNSPTDLAWASSPSWTQFPYDNPNVQPSPITIVGAWLSNAPDAAYIMVDIVRQPGSTPALVSRFYIDPSKAAGYAWCQHDLPIDLQVDDYLTCSGRPVGEYSVEGLYTAGTVDSSPQFVFTPLFNPFNPKVAPSPARLNLPGGLSTDAIASCRNADGSTDLYVAAGGALYYFASTNQQDQATAVSLLSSPLLEGVRDLFASMDEGQIFVWGLNGSDQAFYTACTPGQQTASNAWTLPLPILSGIDLISPFINLGDNANVFFASDGTNLYRMTQSPATTLWARQVITLPPASAQTPAQRFSSYTTRLQLTDANSQPLAKTALQITAATRKAFFINGLYYVLGAESVSVNTDAIGSVTLIEASSGINGTRLTISDGSGDTLTINPMEKPLNKVFALSSISSLQQAQIESPNGTTTPLIPAGTPTDSLQVVATSVAALQAAHSGLTQSRAVPARARTVRQATMTFDATNAIVTDFGDLVSWLESDVEYAVSIVEDAATQTWHFLVTIADQAYSAVLDCVEKIAAAAVWVFNAIKVVIEDLILFLEFLFEWADITRTEQVLKNLIQLWLADKIGNIGQLQGNFDDAIQSLIKQIDSILGNEWSGLGPAASSNWNASSTPVAGLTSPSTYLSYHFQNNAPNLTQTNPPPPPSPDDSPIQALFAAIGQEAAVLEAAYKQLSTVSEAASSETLALLLKQVLAVLTDAVLNGAQAVIDALFAILKQCIAAAFAVLTTPIYIPVVSDILSYFGVPSLTMLDLFCWIAAVPFTLGYKIGHGAAPFPDNSDTTFLTTTTSWTQVAAAFANSGGQGHQQFAASTPAERLGSAEEGSTLSQGVADVVFVAGHAFAGFFTLMACFTDSFEAAEPTGDNDFAIPSTIVAILAGAADGIAVVLTPQNPIKNGLVLTANRITLALRLAGKLIFSGPAQAKFATSTSIMSSLKVGDGRATGAIVDAILVFPALGCSLWHFYELSLEPAGEARSNAIIEETANLAAYVSRVGYSVAVNADNAEAKAAAIGVMDVANVAYLGLQTAEAFIGMSSEPQ